MYLAEKEEMQGEGKTFEGIISKLENMEMRNK